MNDKKTSRTGLGFGELLAVAFIVLKLAGFIDWSWWWVLAPLWIPLVLITVCAAIKYMLDD